MLIECATACLQVLPITESHHARCLLLFDDQTFVGDVRSSEMSQEDSFLQIDLLIGCMIKITERRAEGFVKSWGDRFMRKVIAKNVAYVGLVGGFTVAGLWAYWIWQLEWGVSMRGRALMFLAMAFGALIVLVVVYFAAIWAASTIDRET